MEDNSSKMNQTENEVDLIQVVKYVWDNRMMIIKLAAVFILVGFFIAIFSQKEFTASTIIVPQSSEGGTKLGGGLGGLAAIAGINLGSMGGSEIPPSLYPKIIKSTPFQKEIFQTPLSIEGLDRRVTFEEYYLEVYQPSLLENIKKYTVGLPGVIIKAIRGDAATDTSQSNIDDIVIISKDELILIEILESNLSLVVNDQDGYVNISARMPEAEAAAQLVLRARELLQQAITNFKVQKMKDQLAFVEERYIEKQKEFNEAQRQLAAFTDRNSNIITAQAQLEQERLQRNHDLIYGVYSELAKELETKKIQVKENTPVFTILQPVTIPIEKSKPRRAIIVIVSAILGFIFGIGLLFVQKLIEAFRAGWNQEG